MSNLVPHGDLDAADYQMELEKLHLQEGTEESVCTEWNDIKVTMLPYPWCAVLLHCILQASDIGVRIYTTDSCIPPGTLAGSHYR